MYVHTHWGYNRPYAARTWTVEDWHGYLQGLSRLGFNTVKIWPQLDSMPPEPTASDRAYLQDLGTVIDTAHAEFGMKIIIVLTGNCIGNDNSANYEFKSRPYFGCEKKVNPKDKAEVAQLLQARRNHLSYLRNADAITIIDSDPGGFIDSTNEEFADLCAAQTKVFREMNPKGEFIYWMLMGWENYNTFWKAQRDDPNATPNMWDFRDGLDFKVTLKFMKERIPEPWSVFAGLPEHAQALEANGLSHKAMYYPYGVIEGEPVFPVTICTGVVNGVPSPECRPHPLGQMGNAQTHCLQLPHTYWFAHLAQGGTMADSDLVGFADKILPGRGELIADGWRAIESADGGWQIKLAKDLRAQAGKKHQLGELSGLLFGDADRFLIDLAMNLELRAALTDLVAAMELKCLIKAKLEVVWERLSAYQQRLGFVDAYGGILYERFNQQLKKLEDPALAQVLKDFEDWHNPAVRNGIMPRLLKAVGQYLGHR
jgi:hypothetical protein